MNTIKHKFFFNSENKKNIFTLLLFFLVTFIYNLLRPLKLTLICNATQGYSANTVAAIKLWGIVPGAFLLMYLYTKLSSRLNRDRVFYVMISLFISYFGVFLFLLYPYREFFELSNAASYMQNLLPGGMHGLTLMVRYWHLSLFYIFSELWSTVIISTLLWGLINETTQISKAKKSYGVFALSANAAPIAAGSIGLACTGEAVTRYFTIFTTDPWQASIFLILSLVLITSALIVYLYWALTNIINRTLPTSTDVDHITCKKSSTQKTKFSLLESFSILLKSRYVLFMLIIVISYNLVFNMTDLLWTDQLHLKFQDDALAMKSYLDKLNIIKGALALILAIAVTGYLIQKAGWLVSALVTPAIIVITSIFFFPLVLLDLPQLNTLISIGSVEALLAITLFIGSTQNCLTRASKYTLFDATKELSFIPLSIKQQRQAKAIIDGIGSRIGKSGGAVFFQILSLFFTSVSSALPYIIIVVIIMLSLWVYAIFGLDKEMKKIL